MPPFSPMQPTMALELVSWLVKLLDALPDFKQGFHPGSPPRVQCDGAYKPGPHIAQGPKGSSFILFVLLQLRLLLGYGA
jgi:hypothetical protein